jgi:hypothetical protein
MEFNGFMETLRHLKDTAGMLTGNEKKTANKI